MKIEIGIKLARCQCGGLIMPPILSHTDNAQCVRCGDEFEAEEYANRVIPTAEGANT